MLVYYPTSCMVASAEILLLYLPLVLWRLLRHLQQVGCLAVLAFRLVNYQASYDAPYVYVALDLQ